MRRVITYGTFDLLHTGHINLLRRAKEFGDYLIVAISADEFNAIKGKEAYYTFEQRKAILEAIRYVDEVIPERTWEQKVEDVQKHEVDVFVMGDDWVGKFDFLKDHCDVVYLPRTVGISTTKIKTDLNLSKANNG
ncbi:glycerol-3-phosphate cytidylyltransferase [Lentibacillus sediminis]|uniref:glycerol-3-phosphate cytidylyltransferase n=1 Tax=Lentibacillus sediminis TaxID=1940529 RepID=UPI000C1BAC32|nr:glycerol-3-phosphate cytidylyltransferase [Lentibacillus sediminis]